MSALSPWKGCYETASVCRLRAACLIILSNGTVFPVERYQKSNRTVYPEEHKPGEHRDSVSFGAVPGQQGGQCVLGSDVRIAIGRCVLWSDSNNALRGTLHDALQVRLKHSKEVVCLAMTEALVAVGSQSHVSLVDPRRKAPVQDVESLDHSHGEADRCQSHASCGALRAGSAAGLPCLGASVFS